MERRPRQYRLEQHLTRPGEIDRISAVPPPPSGCRAFYAINARPGPRLVPTSTDAAYSNNVDAMFIAESIGLPTLNGEASFFPPGWDFSNYDAPDYQARVSRFVAAKHLANICVLDLNALRWSRP